MISVINSRTESSRLKEKGNEAFKAADFNGAKLLYAEALQAIQSRKRTEVTDEEVSSMFYDLTCSYYVTNLS